MLQTLVVITIIFLAAVFILKNAYSKINSAHGSSMTCGCGCSGCRSSVMVETRCNGRPDRSGCQ